MSYDIFSSSNLHLKFDQNLKKKRKKDKFQNFLFLTFFQNSIEDKKRSKKDIELSFSGNMYNYRASKHC